MEVGRLAENTKTSLSDVNAAIVKLKKETQTVASFMSENAAQLMEQSSVLNNTVNGIRKMIELLKMVGKNIAIVSQLQTEQQQVIAKTVTVNEGITDSISAQYDDFGNITDLVHTNMEDLESLVRQIDNLNDMVSELEELLMTEK
jgi:methyl-accepting chemotaxis protein